MRSQSRGFRQLFGQRCVQADRGGDAQRDPQLHVLKSSAADSLFPIRATGYDLATAAACHRRLQGRHAVLERGRDQKAEEPKELYIVEGATHIDMLCSREMRSSSHCAALPASPLSAKPAENMITLPTSFRTHAWAASNTAVPGIAKTAQSTPVGSSSIDARHALPWIRGRFGFTR